MRVVLAFCFTIILLSATIRADGAENALDSLIVIALESSPELQAMRSEAMASSFLAKSAGVLPDPRFSMAVMNLPRSSLVLDRTPMSGIQFGLSQTIPWPGKLRSLSRVAGLRSDFADQRVRAVRNRLVRDVSRAYYEYSAQQLIRDKLSENIYLMDAVIEVAQSRYANGDISARDLLSSQTARTRLNIRILEVERRSSEALLKLHQLLGGSGFAEDIPAFLPPLDTVWLYDLAESENPYLQGAELKADEAVAELNLAKRSYWPDFTFGIDYTKRNIIPSDPVNGEDFLSFKVGFNLPLWFFARQNNQRRAAREQLTAANYEIEAATLQLNQKISDSRKELALLVNNIDIYERSLIPQTRAVREAARVAYETGQIDFDALLNSQLSLLEAEIERINLLLRFQIQKANLIELYGVDYEN